MDPVTLNCKIYTANRKRWVPAIRGILNAASRFGEKSHPNGAISYGKRSSFPVYENEWLHYWYPPLGNLEIQSLDTDCGLSFVHPENELIPLAEATGIDLTLAKVPKAYSSFLSFSNGLRLFGGHMNLFGVRRTQDNSEPLELINANVFNRPPNLPEQAFVCSGYPMDGSVVAIMPNGTCERIDQVTGKFLYKWNSFTDHLTDEIERLSKCFDADGVIVDETNIAPPVVVK